MIQRRQVIRVVTAAGMAVLLCATWAQSQETRTYWHVSVEDMRLMTDPKAESSPAFHTHVCVSGKVALVKREADQDWHVRIESLSNSADFIVAEEMPTLKAKGQRPKKGELVTACGVSRWDGKHGWPEVHPVEMWKK